MSETLQQAAARLADDCMEVMQETGNDRLFVELASALGESSQTLEEAFLTEIRVRLAEDKGRRFLKTKLAAHRQQQAAW